MKLCSRKRILAAAVTVMALCFVYMFVVTPSSTMWMPRYLKKNIMSRKFFITFPETRTRTNRTLKILLWTTWFKRESWNLDYETTFKRCEFSNCVLTHKKHDLNDSTALIFHVLDMPVKYDPHFMPGFHRTDQIWILQNSEPPTNMKTDLSGYRNMFNWTATFRKDSDIYMPYVKIRKQKNNGSTTNNIASGKSKGIAWVASNCGDHARRQMLVRELRKYMNVDTFGECGDSKLSRGQTTNVLSKYKFFLAFESAYCVDYVTEKFGAALARHQIPVVSGAADYKSVAPPNSFINVLDFDSVKDLALYLQFLDRNDTAYNQYLQWTREYEVEKTFYMERGICDICKRLNDVTMTSQVYPDVDSYFRQDTCPMWTFLNNKYRGIQGWLIHFGYV